MASDKAYIDALIARLIETLTKGGSFGARRGAAFGVAGVVKGLGIMAMKNFGIMEALKAAVEDKKEAASREVHGRGARCMGGGPHAPGLLRRRQPFCNLTLALALALAPPRVRSSRSSASLRSSGSCSSPTSSTSSRCCWPVSATLCLSSDRYGEAWGVV